MSRLRESLKSFKELLNTDQSIRNRILVVFILLALLIVLFMFSISQGFSFLEQSGSKLMVFVAININIVLIAIVFYMIARNLLKLSNERRRQVLGVNLKKKLITSFIVLSLPAMGFHLFASFFIATNLETWLKGQQESMNNSAQKITGITNRFLEDKKTFKENYKSFLNFIKQDTLIIHNADFDIGFLNHELFLIGEPKLKNPIIDTVSLARSVLNTRTANLDYLCRRFNISLSERNIHGALLDSRLLAEVYLELKGGKQISMSLEECGKSEKSPNQHKGVSGSKITKFLTTKEDLAQHKEMLKNIKDPLWNKYNY